MKRLFAVVGTLFLLTACNSVEELGVSKEVMNANPEIKDLSLAWDQITYAAQTQDCEAFLSHTLSDSGITESDCKEAGRALEEGIPSIDWERSEFNGDRSRVKLYQMEEGDLAYFVLEDKKWFLENDFWNNL